MTNEGPLGQESTRQVQLVTIVIPCFNPTSFLFEAIASARAQSHPKIEIVIVNDGSDRPESLNILERAARLADLYREQPNLGLPAARNTGFRAARGACVIPLDADDVLELEYAATCLAALSAHPEAAFAYTAYSVFGDANYSEPCSEYNLYRLLDRNCFGYAGMIRRSVWERSGGYDETMRFGYEDWEFWLRLAAQGSFGLHLPRPLFRYRKHGPSLYDVALSHHDEIVSYIRGRHAEFYSLEGRARIKARWSPAVCVVVSPAPDGQTILDIEIAPPGTVEQAAEQSRAPAILLCKGSRLDAHSAELAALSVWAGHSRLQLPDGSIAMSRAAALGHGDSPRENAGRWQCGALPPVGTWRDIIVHRHLVNAGLLAWDPWLRHPVQSLFRLIPFRVKERINHAAGRPVFDLSFYQQFRPNALLFGGVFQEPLEYSTKPKTALARIALITPHLGSGGAESVLLDIASALRDAGFELLLLATQSNDDRWQSRWRQQVEHVYDLAAIVPEELMPAAVFSVVRNWRCDHVLLQNSLAGYAALTHIRRELPSVRLIDILHAVESRWNQIATVEQVPPEIDSRVAMNQGVRDRLLANRQPPNKIVLLRAGIDLDRFLPAPERSQDSPRRILFAGRLDPVKRPLLLVDIATRLSVLRPGSDFRIVVAGDGREVGPLRRRVHDARLEQVFEFRGYVEDMAPLYADCDVCVVPSQAEEIPRAVLEAMASARAVVASKAGAIHEVLDDDCGFLIPPEGDELGAFAAALARLFDEPELRQRMGHAGRRKAEAQFDLRNARQAYLQLVEP
ncbi:MAG TPA: glycosyltransferase [Candidatus Acidoferrales bacterium]|jgi:glycosyltransferase involved in cell wall biosynthesis|nr:glycosyltransferase [Candidatus Acidoferrales bacterium]